MPYDDEYRMCHQLSLTILKEYGFGRRLMETRILIEVEDFVNIIKRRPTHTADSRSDSFDADVMLTSSLVNVIYNILFGVRMEDSAGPEMRRIIAILHERIHTFCRELTVLPWLRVLPFYRKRWDWTIDCLNRMAAIVGEEMRAALADEKRDSFTGSYLAAAPDETKANLLLCDLLTAAAETTATTLRWTLVLLANHPDIQSRLQDEIDSVIPRGQRLPVLDDRPRLPFVEAFMLEVMRFKTILPLAVNHTTVCDTEAGGYRIPKNTLVGTGG